MSGVVRLVTDGADYVIDGDTYSRSWFELGMVTDSDQAPVAKFKFENINRKVMNMLAEVDGPAKVQFDVIPSSFFDLSTDPRTVLPTKTVTPIISAKSLYLINVNVDALSVSGTLRSKDYSQEAWPNIRATKELFPGVWEI